MRTQKVSSPVLFPQPRTEQAPQGWVSLSNDTMTCEDDRSIPAGSMLLCEELEVLPHAGVLGLPLHEVAVMFYIDSNGVEKAAIAYLACGYEIGLRPVLKLSFFNKAYADRHMYADTITKIFRIVRVEKPQPTQAVSTIGKKKSRIEASSVIIYQDEQGRQMQIYYRVLDTCPNAQTDQSRDAYTIEQVLYKGRKANIRGRAEQVLLEWLNKMNPANI